MLCTTVVYMHTREQFLKMSIGLGLDLVFARLLRFSILCVFLVWLRLFCPVLFAFVLGLVF